MPINWRNEVKQKLKKYYRNRIVILFYFYNKLSKFSVKPM